jgi:electron transfer flavoprotein beta subunit
MRDHIIIVCVKEVLDPTTRIKWNASTFSINREGKRVINLDDLYAIELALRIKESILTKIIALSLAPPHAIHNLRQLLARGIDDCILITDPSFAGVDTLITSYILAKAIAKIQNYSAIFCGEYTTDSSTGLVPGELAQLLALPLIPSVKEIYNWEPGKIEVESEFEGKDLRISYNLNFPVILTTAGLKVGEVRPPSLRCLLKIKEKEITTWNKEDLGLAEEDLFSPTKVKELKQEIKEKRCQFIKADNLKQQAQLLLKATKSFRI